METLGKAVGAIAGIAVTIAMSALLAALPVYFLWNGLMPKIFELPSIGFWQALGLSLLASCLFKSNTSSSSSK